MSNTYYWTCPIHKDVIVGYGGPEVCHKCVAEHETIRLAAIDEARAVAGEEEAKQVSSGSSFPIAGAVTWLFRGWPRWIIGFGMISWLIFVISIARGDDSPFHADGILARLEITVGGGLLFPLTGAVIYVVFKLIWMIVGAIAFGPRSEHDAVAQMNEASFRCGATRKRRTRTPA